MSTKEKVLELFEANKGEFFSGEKLAGELGVSRSSVWKAVCSLRDDGYKIEAATNRGYCLAKDTDILSAQGIRKYLDPSCGTLDIHTFGEVDSTNAMLRQMAETGTPGGCVIAADSQTRGRGRLGRSFFSPSGTGIYMSVLLRPADLAPGETSRLTTMAAVAACEAIEAASGRRPGIKWVNDLFLDGKKISGILTEASFSMENGRADYVIVGIGINVYTPDGGFPDNIAHIAGSVFDGQKSDGKNLIAAGFLNRLMYYYGAGRASDYPAKYRAASIAIGKRINIITQTGTREATALDVDDDCALIVQYDDGRKERLISGEISIRIS